MWDIKLGLKTHDLVFQEQTVSGLERIQQQVKVALLTPLGDWFLDDSVGIPYFQKIQIKGPKRTEVEAIIRARILQIPGVKSVPTIKVLIDHQTREARIEIPEIICDDGVISFTPPTQASYARPIEITSPQAGSTVYTQTPTIKGTAQPLTWIKVNNEDVFVQGDGSWAYTLQNPLPFGQNLIIAEDAFSQSSVTITVEEGFVLKIDHDPNLSSNARTLRVALLDPSSGVIDWGDGNTEGFTASNGWRTFSHTYTSTSLQTYSLRVSTQAEILCVGSMGVETVFTGFPFVQGTNQTATEVLRWGPIEHVVLNLPALEYIPSTPRALKGNQSYAFAGCTLFDQDLSSWDFSEVTSLEGFLWGTSFNHPVNSWNLQKVKSIKSLFRETSAFNQPFNGDTLTSCVDASFVFAQAQAFNSSTTGLIKQGVKTIEAIFFSQPGPHPYLQGVQGWDTSTVEIFDNAFYGCNSDLQGIEGFDVRQGVSFFSTFGYSSGNPDISSWELLNAVSLEAMFIGNTGFNRDLNEWVLPKVKDLSLMFAYSDYNGDITTWDTSGVVDFRGMFYNAPVFNQELSYWWVESGVDFNDMFRGALSFDQDLSYWCVSSVDTPPANFALSSAFENSPEKHPQWGEPCLPTMEVLLDVDGDAVELERTLWLHFDQGDFTSVLWGDYSVSGGGNIAQGLKKVFTETPPKTLKIRSTAKGVAFQREDQYGFNEDYGDPLVEIPPPNHVVNEVLSFGSAERYILNSAKLTSLPGEFKPVGVASGMLANCVSLEEIPTTWDMSECTAIEGFFQNTPQFRGYVANWDTSSVSLMTGAFMGATSYKEDISSWPVPLIPAKPTNFDLGAGFFNQPELQPQWGSTLEITTAEGTVFYAGKIEVKGLALPNATLDVNGDLVSADNNGEWVWSDSGYAGQQSIEVDVKYVGSVVPITRSFQMWSVEDLDLLGPYSFLKDDEGLYDNLQGEVAEGDPIDIWKDPSEAFGHEYFTLNSVSGVDSPIVVDGKVGPVDDSTGLRSVSTPPLEWCIVFLPTHPEEDEGVIFSDSDGKLSLKYVYYDLDPTQKGLVLDAPTGSPAPRVLRFSDDPNAAGWFGVGRLIDGRAALFMETDLPQGFGQPTMPVGWAHGSLQYGLHPDTFTGAVRALIYFPSMLSVVNARHVRKYLTALYS